MPPVVPEAWKPRLREYLRKRTGEERDCLSAGDFPCGQSVLIRFPDRSHAHFQYAFAIRDERVGKVAVFTEHCGYHVFPLAGTEIETLQTSRVWLDPDAKLP